MLQVCHTTEHLWICLICGHVGCGRYSGEHAKQHFQETSHTYSLELETQRVWDYAGDGYGNLAFDLPLSPCSRLTDFLLSR